MTKETTPANELATSGLPPHVRGVAPILAMVPPPPPALLAPPVLPAPRMSSALPVPASVHEKPAPAAEGPPPAREGEVLARDCGNALPLPECVVAQLPSSPPRDLARMRSLAAVLTGIRAGGEPLGPLVLPARQVSADKAGSEKRKAKRESPQNPAAFAAPSPGLLAPEPSLDAVPTPAERQWPNGPLVGRDLMTADEVRRLVEHILQDEEIMDHPSMPGLTRARLREAARAADFEPNRFGRLSAAVMVWFARAGVTVLEDDKAPNEWIRPRPLISTERAELRRRLQAVDPPDGDAITIARNAGLDSSAT